MKFIILLLIGALMENAKGGFFKPNVNMQDGGHDDPNIDLNQEQKMDGYNQQDQIEDKKDEMFNREPGDEDWDKDKKEEIENRLSWRKTMKKIKFFGIIALIVFSVFFIIFVIMKCRSKNKQQKPYKSNQNQGYYSQQDTSRNYYGGYEQQEMKQYDRKKKSKKQQKTNDNLGYADTQDPRNYTSQNMGYNNNYDHNNQQDYYGQQQQYNQQNAYYQNDQNMDFQQQQQYDQNYPQQQQYNQEYQQHLSPEPVESPGGVNSSFQRNIYDKNGSIKRPSSGQNSAQPQYNHY